jgi:hypothetical protein
MFAAGALLLIDAMPFSIASTYSYIALFPTTWALVAMSAKYGLPFFAFLRSKRPSSSASFWTEAMPFFAPGLLVYCSRVIQERYSWWASPAARTW